MIRSKSTTTIAFWCTLCLWFFITPHAWGQNMKKLYTQEIRTLYRKGKLLVQKKAYKRAILQFKAALALIDQSQQKLKNKDDQKAMRKRKAAFLYVIARTYHYDKQHAQAYLSYQKSLAAGAQGKTAVLAASRMHQLRAKVLVKLSLNATPAGVSFRLTDALNKTIDGRMPYSAMQPPGTYTLTLQKPGFKQRKETLQVLPSKGLKASFSMRQQFATIELRSRPAGATITMQSQQGNKTYQGKTPFVRQVPPGQYTLQLTLPGHMTQKTSLSLKTDMRLQREFAMQPIKIAPRTPRVTSRPQPQRPLPPLPHPKRNAARAAGWSTLILAALASGGSVALYFLANDAIAQYNTRAGNPTFQNDSNEIYGDYSRGQTMRMAAHVSVGVAAAAAVTAMSMFIWNGGKQPTRQPPPPKSNARVLLK